MSSPSSCCAPCPTTETVNVPGIQGDPGTDGIDGTDGVNAYTVTTVDFVTPAIGFTVPITVAVNTWCVVGENIFIGGAGVYQVTVISGTTGLTVKNLGYVGNTVAGVNIVSGAGVTPSGTQPDVSGFAAKGANSDITSLTGLSTPLAVSEGGSGRAAVVAPLDTYAAGTNAVMSNANATLTFGTTQPVLTFVTTGKYRVTARVLPFYNAITAAASETATFTLRVTSPGPALVANSQTIHQFSAGNIGTRRSSVVELPPVIYDATAGDVVKIFAILSSNPFAGTYEVVEADIHADPIPLY